MSERNPALGTWIKRFLMEYLPIERNLAINTLKSYRDCLTMLLPFVAKRCRKPVERLAVEDLSAGHVTAFLGHLEKRAGLLGADPQPAPCGNPVLRPPCLGARRRSGRMGWQYPRHSTQENGAAPDCLAVAGRHGRHDRGSGQASRYRAGRACSPAVSLQHRGESLRGGGTAGRGSASPGTHGRKRTSNDPRQGRKDPHHSDMDEHSQGPCRALQRPSARLRERLLESGIANPTPGMASSNSWSVPQPVCRNLRGEGSRRIRCATMS